MKRLVLTLIRFAFRKFEHVHFSSSFVSFSWRVSPRRNFQYQYLLKLSKNCITQSTDFQGMFILPSLFSLSSSVLVWFSLPESSFWVADSSPDWATGSGSFFSFLRFFFCGSSDSSSCSTGSDSDFAGMTLICSTSALLWSITTTSFSPSKVFTLQSSFGLIFDDRHEFAEQKT